MRRTLELIIDLTKNYLSINGSTFYEGDTNYISATLDDGYVIAVEFTRRDKVVYMETLTFANGVYTGRIPDEALQLGGNVNVLAKVYEGDECVTYGTQVLGAICKGQEPLLGTGATSKLGQLEEAIGKATEFKDTTEANAQLVAEKTQIVVEKELSVSNKAQDVATKHSEVVTLAGQVTEDKQATLMARNEAEGFAVQAEESADEAEESANIAASNLLNGVSTHNADNTSHGDIRDYIRTVEAIARGKATGFVFDTYDDMIAFLDIPENVESLTMGDNLYIRALDVKDYWWDGTGPQVLEAEAPDLTNYYTREQVDGMMPIKVTEAEYNDLLTSGGLIAGRTYEVIL